MNFSPFSLARPRARFDCPLARPVALYLGVILSSCAPHGGGSEDSGTEFGEDPSSAKDASGAEGSEPASDASVNASDASSGRDAGGSATKDAGPTSRPTCGGIAGLKCESGLFCNYEAPRGQGCDAQVADAAGVCESLPQICADLSDPVCGCDAKTYANACEAHSQGASVAKKGACATKGTSCDRRALTCRRAEPPCPEGQVAAIVGNCFGDCVGIDACACSEAAACPQPEKYVCHMSAMHCGPYVN